MPLNFNNAFKRHLEFKKRSQKCRWVSHFTGCAREVAGALELLANNRPDRFVYSHVDAIVELCNKQFQVKGAPAVKKYSKRHVEDCLKLFRDLQILSDKAVADVYGVQRPGRFFNPHDAMTSRYPLACTFVGCSKKNGVWRGGIWQPDDEGQFGGLVVEENTTPDTTPDSTPDATSSVDRITVSRADAITVSRAVPITVPGVVDSPEKSVTSSSEQKGSGVLPPSEPLKPLEPSEPPQPLQPLDTGGSGSGDDLKTRSDGKQKKLGLDQLAIDLFVQKTGKTPSRVSAEQRQMLKQLATDLGRQDYVATIKEWIIQAPWDDETKCHLKQLLDNFQAYRQAAKVRVAKATEKAGQKANEERSLKLNVLQNCFHPVWNQPAPNDEFLATVSAADRDKWNRVKAIQWDRRDANDLEWAQSIVQTFDAWDAAKRKAEKAAEDEAAAETDKLLKGSW